MQTQAQPQEQTQATQQKQTLLDINIEDAPSILIKDRYLIKCLLPDYLEEATPAFIDGYYAGNVMFKTLGCSKEEIGEFFKLNMPNFYERKSKTPSYVCFDTQENNKIVAVCIIKDRSIKTRFPETQSEGFKKKQFLDDECFAPLKDRVFQPGESMSAFVSVTKECAGSGVGIQFVKLTAYYSYKLGYKSNVEVYFNPVMGKLVSKFPNIVPIRNVDIKNLEYNGEKCYDVQGCVANSYEMFFTEESFKAPLYSEKEIELFTDFMNKQEAFFSTFYKSVSEQQQQAQNKQDDEEETKQE